MRATFRRVIAILDGTPTGARGQSLVEMTITMPLLLIMIMGLVEIGWYANNYLTLLDVVREAGRFGANRDPMTWINGEELNYHRLDCDTSSIYFDNFQNEQNTTSYGPPNSYPTNQPADKRYGIRSEQPVGYYDGIACTVVGSLAPLNFRNDEDDVVVSVFSYVVLNRGTEDAEVRVVGRYPARTNECAGDDTHDPFDWKGTASGDYTPNGSGSDPDELGGIANNYDDGYDNVRGYVYRGNHHNDYGAGVPCLGSSFSTDDVEELLNFPDSSDQMRKLSQANNFGLVLVEVYWMHYQLLGMPWFNLGPLDEGYTVHVWAFFPVSAAEPDLNY